MSVTEVVFLPLQEGKIPDDRNSAAGQVHNEILRTLLCQPGVQRVCWGREVEDPQMLRWFVDWDDIEDHKKFMNSDVYMPFLKRFGSIVGGPAKAYHARFAPHPPAAALSNTTSPVTEIVTLWFPTTYSQEDQDKVVESLKAFISVFEKEAKNYRASAGGWVDEEVDFPGTNEKGKAYMLLVGWISVEAHMEFRDSQAFKDNIHLVFGTRDLKTVEAVHASLTEVTRSSGSHVQGRL